MIDTHLRVTHRPHLRLGRVDVQDQVLRNHAVGSTCRVAVSGPALVTCTVISRSSALALA